MKRRCEGDGVGFGGTEGGAELSGETGRRKSDKVHVDERSDGGREKGKGRRDMRNNGRCEMDSR